MKYTKALVYESKVDTFLTNSHAFATSQKLKQTSRIIERKQQILLHAFLTVHHELPLY